MIITLILLGIIVLGILIGSRYDEYDRPIWSEFMVIFSSIFLFVHLLIWTLNPLSIKRDIIVMEAKIETINNARTMNYGSIENAAITNRVIDINSQIESWKFYNNIWILDCYIPDEVEELQLIRYFPLRGI